MLASLAFVLAASTASFQDSAPAQTSPSESSPSEAELVAGIAQMQAQLDKKAWSAAAKLSRELLAAHGKQPYTWLHLPDLREALAFESFHRVYKAPKWEELTSGSLRKYVETRGTIDLSYSMKQLGDFVPRNDGQIEFTFMKWPWEDVSRGVVVRHPARFAGAYTLEISGAKYSPVLTSTGSPHMVELDFDHDSGALIDFGYRTVNPKGQLTVTPARLFLVKSGVLAEVDRREESPCECGKRFSLAVSVTESRVKATYNGKPLLQAEKPSTAIGQFAFTTGSSLETIRIEGAVETAWLHGARDEHFDAAWRDHFKSGRVADPLLAPFDKPKPTPWSAISLTSFPGEATEELNQLGQRVFGPEGDGLTALLGEFRAAVAAGPITVDQGWLLALLEARLGLVSSAQKRTESLLEARPEFAPARRLLAWALVRRDRENEAVPILRELLEKEPEHDGVASDLADVLFQTSRFEELDALLRSRAALDRFTEHLADLNELRRRVLRGPRWTQTFTFESDHFVVKSDTDIKTCREVARELESSIRAFQARVRPLPKDKGARLECYVFSGRAGYQRYLETGMDVRVENTAGLYHPGLRQLLVWNLPARDEMLRTVRHEGFHQYLHRLMNDAPRWLNEGLAEYYENAEYHRAESQEIRPHPEHLAVLTGAGSKIITTSQFIRLRPEQFYADMSQHYAQAWALVHFLLAGDRANRALFDRLLDALIAGIPPAEAVDTAFDGVDFAKFDEALRNHILRLRDSR